MRRVQRGEAVDLAPEDGNDLPALLLSAVAEAARTTRLEIERLHGAASTDTLTGLRNRRGFAEQLEARLKAGRTGAVAVLDVDLFKQVNDRLGHDEGDRVLRALAARIGDNIRDEDIASRWGGDEFVIFFEGLRPEEAEEVLGRVDRSLAERPAALLDGRPVGLSVGCAEIDRPGRKAREEAIANADRRMYAAKKARRHRAAA